MLEASIQSHIHADNGPFSTVLIATNGVDYATVTLSGWLPFSEYLDLIVTALETESGDDWEWQLIDSDEETPRVEFSTTGDPVRMQFSESQADLLGFSDITTAFDTTLIGDTEPGGYVEVYGFDWSEPQSTRETNLTEYRHGRLVAYPWGEGVQYKVHAVMPWSAFDRFTSGPCSVGKQRFVGANLDAIDQDDYDGLIDGHILAVSQKEALNDCESDVEVTFSVYVPAIAARDTRTEELGHSVFGPLKRGFNFVYYLIIEGIPYVITEKDIGMSLSGYAVSESLVIDDSGSVGWLVDRSKGIVQSQSFVFAVLDYANALGWFQKPTEVYTLAQDLPVGALIDPIEVNEDISNAPASGGLYLGKEYMVYDSLDIPNQQFRDVVRGAHGPMYQYDIEAIQPYNTLSTVPLLTTWAGRTVELWAALVDPYGRATGTQYGGESCIQLFLGTLAGLPHYSQSGWQFTAHSIERRLARQIGPTSQAKVSGIQGEKTESDPSKTFVLVPSDAGFDVFIWVPDEPEPLWFPLSVCPVAPTITARWTLSTLADRIAAVFWNNVPGSGEVFIDPESWVAMPGGAVRCSLVFWAVPNVTVEIRREATTPAWFPTLAPSACAGTYDLVWDLGATSYLFISESQVQDLGVTPIPASGYAIVGDGNTAELLHYTAKTALDEAGQSGDIYALTADRRGITGTVADWTKNGAMVRETAFLDASLPDILRQLLCSSGITGLRSLDYDVHPQGCGYGIDERWIDLGSFDEAPLLLTTNVRPILCELTSLEELFGGLLAANHLCIGPVRYSNQIRLGLFSTRPLNSIADCEIGDSNLLMADSARSNELLDGPTIVRMSLEESPIAPGKNEIIQRNVSAIDAKDGKEWAFKIQGLSETDFFLLCPILGEAILRDTNHAEQLALACVPWADYVPGQNAEVSISHPGVWDVEHGGLGFSGYGRVYGVSRALVTGRTEVTVHTGGGAYGVLVPGCQIVGIDGDDVELGAGEGTLFNVGDRAVFLTPGIDADVATALIAAVVGDILTVDAVPGFAVVGETIVTYPDEGSGTAHQDSFVHVDDGNTWE